MQFYQHASENSISMINLFDKDSIFFTIAGYPLSYLEFIGWVSGIVAVALSSLGNLWSWLIGIINVVLSFFLFYQVQLYPDMFLQVFFFVTNIMGWWRWAHPKKGEENANNELKISLLTGRSLLVIFAITLAFSSVLGLLASDLHHLLPVFFSKPSASPYLDSLVMVLSIVATYLMVQKKVECWALWIAADIIATYLYFIRDIKFYSMLYFIFCFIAAFGLWNWHNQYQKSKSASNAL
jgi:nicotinamide mononucleotide transporter